MRPDAARAWRGAGFTLIESLAVVFIVALAASLLVISAAPGDGARVEKEARRLAALLETACAEARVSGRTIAWAPDAAGYAFWYRREEGDWAPFPDSSPYRHRTLPADVVLRDVRADARELAQGEWIVLPRYGYGSTLQATISAGGAGIILRGSSLGRISLERLHAG
jgi:type II secretion system protein H